MSRITFESNPNGTGVYTIASPSGNTDRTLTLPDEAGTILTTSSTSYLGVDGITSSATGTAITIDSSDRVTTPSQPSFFASRGTGVNVTQSTGFSKWTTFATTQHNIGSHYSIANSRFTAPIDGVYMFGANCRFDSVSSGYARLVIGVNGSTDYDDQSHSIIHTNEGANYHTMCVTALYQLSANDYVEVFSYSDQDTDWQQQSESTWWGRLVG